MDIKKHVGRLKNTDRRIAVLFMQIPGREDHALVVDTDALPDSYHDALMGVIDSVEGQQSTVLANILGRRILPDTGQDIMNALNARGFLQAQPITNIVMYPRPNMAMPLEDIIRMMRQTPEQAKAEVEAQRDRFQETQSLDTREKQEATARNLIQQAQDLQSEAARKLEQAYDLAPQFRPTQQATPSPKQVMEALRDESPAAPVLEEVADVDVSDLPADVAAAFLEAVQAEPYVAPVADETVAHEISAEDDQVQAFLDRAAYREDKEKAASEPVVKRPVGRPRKNAK